MPSFRTIRVSVCGFGLSTCSGISFTIWPASLTSTMRLLPLVSSEIEPNVPAGMASSGQATSRRLSGWICAPKRSAPVATTIVRVATVLSFGATTRRESSA